METRHDPNGPMPHNYPRSISRFPWGVIPGQRKPEHDALPEEPQEIPNYDALFELMKLTEKAYNFVNAPLADKPSFGREGWELERAGVLFHIRESQQEITMLIERFKGVPIQLTEETGEIRKGKIISSRGFTYGHWEVDIEQPGSPSPTTLFKTAQQLHEGFLAATLDETLPSTEESQS